MLLLYLSCNRSFMKILNSKGPSIDPCGTPLLLVTQLEKETPHLYSLLSVD